MIVRKGKYCDYLVENTKFEKNGNVLEVIYDDDLGFDANFTTSKGLATVKNAHINSVCEMIENNAPTKQLAEYFQSCVYDWADTIIR